MDKNFPKKKKSSFEVRIITKKIFLNNNNKNDVLTKTTTSE